MTGRLTRNTYDKVPYPSLPMVETHPDRLATLATLFGMSPAPIDRCRVLEIGTADGGNLAPMAFSLPHSEFVGIDSSARQIADGQRTAQVLGLKNLTLKVLDILDIDASLGQFDYLIVHGVYSWVPVAVRDKILDICRANLAPNGVAYVSYNTYPGWHIRGMLREMLLYRTRQTDDPQARVDQARGFLDFLAEAAQAAIAHRKMTAVNNNAYSLALQHERDLLARQRDSYVAHEHLEDVNEPVYFHQFVERAVCHGLQYLADAEFSSMQVENYPPHVAETLTQLATDSIELEQYLDFVCNRTFRRTLLCHADIQLNRKLSPECLSALYVASQVRPVSPQPDLHSAAPEKFRGPTGTTLTVSNPIAKAALLYLGEIWPEAIRFDALLAKARARCDPAAPPIYSAARLARDKQGVGDMLLRCFGLDLIELHVYQPSFQTEISERPVASPIARLQAGLDNRVTNLRHEEIRLDDEVSSRLLPYLDGEHDHVTLLQVLSGLVGNGELVVQSDDGASLEDEQQVQAILAETLDRNLQRLARAALLTA